MNSKSFFPWNDVVYLPFVKWIIDTLPEASCFVATWDAWRIIVIIFLPIIAIDIRNFVTKTEWQFQVGIHGGKQILGDIEFIPFFV